MIEPQASNFQFSHHTVADLIDHLKTPYSNHEYDDIWGTFVLLEMSGFDVSLMQRTLDFRINVDRQESNPFGEGRELNREELRKIVIALRQYVRRTGDMPALSNEEINDWIYKIRNPTQQRVSLLFDDSLIMFDKEQVQKTLDKLKIIDGDLISAYELILAINFTNRNAEGGPALGGRWLYYEISTLIANLRLDLSGRNVTGLLDAVWAELNRTG